LSRHAPTQRFNVTLRDQRSKHATTRSTRREVLPQSADPLNVG
jgi:hypothetical protein